MYSQHTAIWLWSSGQTLCPTLRPTPHSWPWQHSFCSFYTCGRARFLPGWDLAKTLHVSRHWSINFNNFSWTLSQLDQTQKGIAKEAIEQNELLRATWQAQMSQYNSQQLVFINETTIDDYTNIQCKGQTLWGQACVHRMSFLHGQKYSILPALGLDGIFALDIFEGSVNHERFIDFLCDHLVSFIYT